MDSGHSDDRHYWHLLTEADAALDQGDYSACERLFQLAVGRREESPGRVFVTEKLGDGLLRLFSRGTGRGAGGTEAGRWARRTRSLQEAFLVRGEAVVREGVRLAELRPEDDAEANQPILETALYLVSRSRIFSEEPASSVPLLKGLFRTARRTGRPFDVHLVRHDLPLTEEDRLWLARRGGELLESFLEQGLLEPGSRASQEWSEVFLQLLQPRYFGSTSRLQEERAWLEAITADRLRGHAVDSVRLYRAYLQINPEPGQRPDEARVRLLELLGNTDGPHFPVPRYSEALGAMQSAGLAPGSQAAGRYQAALASLEYRRPTEDDVGGCWASVGSDAAGRLSVALWWGGQPRDLASWNPGDDPEPLAEFLAPCQGRIIAADPSISAVVNGIWEDEPPVWTVRDFAAALLEPLLPTTGPDPVVLRRLAVAETGPWRGGWNPLVGHPQLKPPAGSPHAGEPLTGPAAAALEAGLLWLAVRSRVDRADPSLRGGICELSHRGDPAAGILYEFLVLGDGAQGVVDASFEPWTLPLLWTRQDPMGWGGGTATAQTTAQENESRPDLGRNDLALVGTGDPASVLAAWGEGRQKWRVVLDRLDRFAELAPVAGRVIGPITLIPPEGQVHSLPGALGLLETRLAESRRHAADPVEGMVPLFHWMRLVETHNGDLLDFRQVRPRPGLEWPLYDRYVQLVDSLDREAPKLSGDGGAGTWAEQFSQRVRKAGLVAGSMQQLVPDSDRLDSTWGVFEGSEASWVFLDSAAVHWHLWRRPGLDMRRLHGLLHSRGGRHLSLLTGALWCRDDLDRLLGSWLQVFGAPYCLTLLDGRTPPLRLAAEGVAPDAVEHGLDALLPAAVHIEAEFARAGGGCLLLPGSGRTAPFWREVADRKIPLARVGWDFLEADSGFELQSIPPCQDRPPLAVPVLACLEGLLLPRATADTPEAWREADRERRKALDRGRQLCSLELAGLLAGPWASVDVLDVRWRRLMPARAGTEADEGFAAASDLLDGRTFALPVLKTGERSGGSDWLVQARSWYRAWPTDRPEPAEAAALPELGLNLLLGEGTTWWDRSTQWLSSAWERAEPGPWFLLVTDEAPAGALELAVLSGAGFTVWPPEDPALPPGAVVWARPGNFADPALATLLAERPPALVAVDDVVSWLPAPDRDGQSGAVALRALLGAGVDRVLLQASWLSAPWLRFLERTAGARVRLADPELAREQEPSPSETRETERLASPAFLDCGRTASPQANLERLRRLLNRLREVLEPVPAAAEAAVGRGVPGPGRQVVPVSWLEWMAGLEAEPIVEGVRVLRWAARLAGDPLSAASGPIVEDTQQDCGHSMLIPYRFAELESRLDRLEELLHLLLPLWWQGLRPGAVGWVDLAFPPARLPAEDLADVDRLLSCLGSAARDNQSGLVYRCPRGALASSRRLVGVTERPDLVLEQLSSRLRLFRSRIGDVLAGAVETGEGFLVRTGLESLRPDEEEFLALGATLGFWRWFGPTGPGWLPLVDLLTLADSATARGDGEAWGLLKALLVDPRFDETAPPGGLPLGGAKETGLRAWLPRSTGRDDLEPAVERVAALCGVQESVRFLVLRGLAGTGRHEALIRGLDQAGRSVADLAEVTVFCPDAGVAAQVARLARQSALPQLQDLRIVEGDQLPPAAQSTEALLTDTSGQVIVVCEIQRFAAETRYRLAQLGRGRRLLLTVDPAAADEPWENLFLTTPRASDVVTLETQRRLARRLWSEVRLLVGDQLAGRGSALRREKGLLTADYAANLDQCFARLLLERQGERLPDRLRLTGALPADLEYLGARLREQGWLALAQDELDFLLLPGVCEFLAAATDQLVTAGGLRPEADPVAPENPQTPPTPPALLLEHLLPPLSSSAWREFLDDNPAVDPQFPLADFLARIQGEPWAGSFLSLPAARTRVAELLRRWPGVTLEGMTRLPEWEAWRSQMLEDLDLPGPTHRRPLVTLTTADRPAAGWTPGGVYLCRGTEPDRRHYEVLGRITDNALILYQERSPLPGDVAR